MRWRLIVDGDGNAAQNMALDESLFLSALRGDAPPTLRIYGWSRPALSVGYRQTVADVCDLEACRRHNVGLVRRPTGGRAVLHVRELTYSVTATTHRLFHGLSVRGVYQWITQVLRTALAWEGIPLDPSPAAAPPPPPPSSSALPCLSVPTGHEITCGGRKLVASAQKWSRHGFLQHGSILLRVDRALWDRIAPPGASRPLMAVGVADLVPGCTLGRLRSAVIEAFRERFAAEPERSISAREREEAAWLSRRKYSSPVWTFGRQPPHEDGNRRLCRPSPAPAVVRSRFPRHGSP